MFTTEISDQFKTRSLVLTGTITVSIRWLKTCAVTAANNEETYLLDSSERRAASTSPPERSSSDTARCCLLGSTLELPKSSEV
ncbi:hypothetical protein K0M31_003023 [Melipona bicolor]|uniref:Uncharacterized protein n=1 Tax=Melipona bicolor TaxID=60889 RepID=A0AA40KQ24_9HYME|nr:hypothetical protein K0M31_003023 [Melipona bicolor]